MVQFCRRSIAGDREYGLGGSGNPLSSGQYRQKGSSRMNVEHISASRIKTFEQCQLKYWAIYIAKLPESPPHPNTRMGSAVHTMMEESTNARIKNLDDKTHHDPMSWINQAVQEHKVDNNLIPTIVELVGNAQRWGYFRNIKKTAGCELEIGFKLPDGTDVTGFIDRLDVMSPDADIIDLKTQKNVFDDDELKENWQAKINNIGARKLFPEITGSASVSFWVLRHQVQRVILSARDAEEDIQRIQDQVSKIKACENPSASPSPLCQWCPNEKGCKAANGNARDRLRGMTRK